MLRHWLYNPQPTSGLQTKVVAGWFQAAGSVRSQAGAQNSSEIDIDHIVPLKWAWERGAKGWTRAKRERFANDMVNLSPVDLGLNRSTITI
ncbi:HNH endonuclease family protein [Marinobacter salarius]|uniref:HNH endonuclease family protein n=1 Tax=Marinobacter salarius TaxID=1420917 RepID=UPI003BA9FA7D